MFGVLNQRQQRAATAKVLLGLHAQEQLDDPARWSWAAVGKVPPWCLASADERCRLQQVCGALYLSPDIRCWISKQALLAATSLLGESIFARIITQADAMQLPRESASEVIAGAGVDPALAGSEEIQRLFMETGATVLAATVDESLPREMLTDSLGPTMGEISGTAAAKLMVVAQTLLNEAEPAQAPLA